MFGSTNPFGQSSNSPFGSPSVFGQTSSATTNPFAPKPFGSPSPFGSQSGSSIFGTSTGVFGQPSSPLGSTSTFGASTAPAFGSSIPAFGASSTPSSSFGGSAVFGQKPSLGGFGSTPSQPNPFGSSFQSQPAYGTNLFGSTAPFGASSQPTFGTTSTAFGAMSTPAFGVASSPAFGAASSPAFGATTSPAFGSSSTPAFGASTTPAFGSTTTPAFGTTSTSLFGSTGAAFGASSTPSSSAPFSFGSSPSFGQSAPAFGSTPFGTIPSPFGSQSSPFGQSTSPTFGAPGFGQPGFGSQRGGSRVSPYSATPEADSGSQPAGKLESISAMPVYKDKSHEELRWEDYQLGDKGGPNPSAQPAGGIGFSTSTQANPFGSTGTFGQPATSPFSSAAASNPFAPKPSAFASSASIFSSSFSASSSSPFGSSSSPSLFGAASTPGFGSTSSPSVFGGTTTPAFSSSTSIFGTSMVGSSPAFGSGLTFGNTQSSGLFQSSTPSLGQTPSPFRQQAGFQQTAPGFGSNIFSTPSTGFGSSLFSSSAPSILSTSNPMGFGQSTPSLSTSFQPVAPAYTSGAFSFGNFGQTQPASSGGFGSISNVINQGTFGQSVATQTNMVMQAVPVTNPFGTLPAMPQMSIGRVGSAPSVQYGISSMPVPEKPILVRTMSLLTPRHLSQRRIRLPARKYHPKSDGQRVPFFSDDETTPATPKADALFIPRENPRTLIIRPIEQWPSRTSTESQPLPKQTAVPAMENGKVSGEPSAPFANGSFAENHDGNENQRIRERSNALRSPFRISQKPNGVENDDQAQKEMDSSYIMMSGHRAGEAAIVFEHGADIEALMPKLRHAEYYTEPRVQELAAKERADPGFCCHVKDFVVGRHGYGNIKFFGETDVRRLDLETIVQFNNREVIVYKDESKKPAVGQGLNKPAEVTLLNIKCMNKKTGQQYTEGPKVEKYKEMLIRKADEQGAEFVSYDPVQGEWKFRVKHFSCYEFGDVDLDASKCYDSGGGDTYILYL